MLREKMQEKVAKKLNRKKTILIPYYAFIIWDF